MKTRKIKNLLSLLITLFFMASLMIMMSTCQKDFESEEDYLSLDELQENKIKTSGTSFEYDAVRLGWPHHTNMRITGFNNEGQILGFSEATSYLWDDGVLTPLQLLNDAVSCRAFDMNAFGMVAGTCLLDGHVIPVYWNIENGVSGAQAFALSLGDEFVSGTARGINDDGMIVGYLSEVLLPNPLTQFTHLSHKAVYWDNINSEPQTLNFYDPGTEFDTWSSIAIYINNDGYIAGGSNTYDAGGNVIESRGVVWPIKDLDPIELDLMAGQDRWTDNHRMGLNNQGDVTSITTVNGQRMAAVWIYDVNNVWSGPITMVNANTGQIGVPYRGTDVINVPGSIVISSNVTQAVIWSVCENDHSVSVNHQLPFPEELTYDQKFGVALFMNNDGWIAGFTNDRRNPRFYNDMDVTLWTPGETTEDPHDPGDPDPDDPDPDVPDPDDPGDLSIDNFILTNTSNPQFARVLVDWEVSGVDLSVVTLSIAGPNSASSTWNVSGSSASGQHEFSFRRGHGNYTLTLMVTDSSGYISETKNISL